MPSYKVNIGGDGPAGWAAVPPDHASDPYAVVVYVREPLGPSPRIVVRECFMNWPVVDIQKHAQDDAERLNATITRSGYISNKPISQYGQELEFIEAGVPVKGDRLYSTAGTADGRSYLLELIFSSPHDQYDLVKPEFVLFLQNLKVVEDEG